MNTPTETPFTIVRMVFPDASDAECESLLWNRTGFPGFWRTGNPRRDILHSLRRYKRTLASGKPVCDLCNDAAVTPRRDPRLCRWCDKAINRQPTETE